MVPTCGNHYVSLSEGVKALAGVVGDIHAPARRGGAPHERAAGDPVRIDCRVGQEANSKNGRPQMKKPRMERLEDAR